MSATCLNGNGLKIMVQDPNLLAELKAVDAIMKESRDLLRGRTGHACGGSIFLSLISFEEYLRVRWHFWIISEIRFPCLDLLLAHFCENSFAWNSMWVIYTAIWYKTLLLVCENFRLIN